MALGHREWDLVHTAVTVTRFGRPDSATAILLTSTVSTYGSNHLSAL